MDERIILSVKDDPDDEAPTRNNIKNDIIVVRDETEAPDHLFRCGAHAVCDACGLATRTLLDLTLPKVEGLEVLEQIRDDACMQLLPIVVHTPSRKDPDRSNGYRLDVNSYVRKPLTRPVRGGGPPARPLLARAE